MKAGIKNAGKDGYGMYDYQLLDRIVTLEKKLGMPATFPNWRGPLPSGTAVEFAGALSVPFGCAILKNLPEGQDGDMMLVLDADEVPDVLADAAEGAHWSCTVAESVPEQGHASGMLMHSDARTSSMVPRNTPTGGHTQCITSIDPVPGVGHAASKGLHLDASSSLFTPQDPESSAQHSSLRFSGDRHAPSTAILPPTGCLPSQSPYSGNAKLRNFQVMGPPTLMRGM
eukprot:jgi/Botrbrau1/12090/Bobra.0186s0014.1